jgi:tetratricopeptide (TPR) repeat protein/tRNA A-37 threonylcarbamoyl transferase component Bud32
MPGIECTAAADADDVPGLDDGRPKASAAEPPRPSDCDDPHATRPPSAVDSVAATTAPGDDAWRTTAPLPANGSPSAARGDFPARIADYDILAPIAKGGMGVVYKARQRRLGRLVALKTIRRAEAASDEDVRRFQAEAEAAARLDHPGIVPIFEVGEEHGRHFLSMALVEGGSLAARLASGPLEPRAAARLVRVVAEAVAYAHDRGIVHRDLKPANILLAADGTPKVTDFGLAKRVETDDGLTMSGQVLGTPQYMPPEQARGELRDIGPRSDVYSLGAILYHAVTGRPPFTAATVVATLRQLLEAEPVPPRQLNPQVDRDLETIALTCLEKDPARRYQSAAACAADLARYLEGLPIVARRTSPVERAVKWARRRPAVALLAVMSVLMLVSLAAGGVFYADAANKRAALATRQLREQVVLDQTRRDVQAAILQAADLLRDRDLAEADGVIRAASARAGDTASLEPERRRLAAARLELERLRDADRRQAEARAALAAFRSHRDEAIFYGSQAFGLDPRRNQGRAAAAARAGLAIWGLDRDAATEPQVPADLFSTSERTQIAIQCEELLLLLADAILQSAQDPVAAAVAESERLIDRCVGLKRGESRATHLMRAECRRRMGDAAAVEREQQLAEGGAGAETASEHFLVGRLLLQREGVAAPGFVRAKGEFEQAMLADPDHFWAQYCLAMHALRGGRPELADVHLTSCLSRRPEFAWPWILRGAARTALGEHSLAEADFGKGLALTDEGEARHVGLVNWAALAFGTGRIDTAREKLREAIALEPTGHQALLTLAAVEKAAGNEAAALAALGQAAVLAPDAPLVRRERARLHLLAGRHSEAAEDLREAVRLETGNPQARVEDLSLLAEAEFHQGRLDDALATWDRALAADGDHARSHLGRATVLIERRRLHEARDALDAYLRRGRPSLEFHLTRALCRASLGDYAGAIDDYSRAIEIRPSAETLTQRGWLYTLRGSPLFGLQDFERAVALDADHADAHAGRGLALAYLGRHADATAAAERALELGEPSFRHVFKAATVFAAASPRVVFSEQERQQQGPTPGQLRVRYIQRAADLLDLALGQEAAHRHDDLWGAHVQEDEHFRPLLQEPEFRKLAENVEQRAAPGAAAGTEEAGETVGERPDGEAPR